MDRTPYSSHPRLNIVPVNAADVIRSWRLRAGLTQEGLAQALCVTFSTVSRWENGHVRPSKLAWLVFERLAAERSCPLFVEEPN